MILSILRPLSRFLAPVLLITSGMNLTVYAMDHPSLNAGAAGSLVIQAPDNVCGYIEGFQGEVNPSWSNSYLP